MIEVSNGYHVSDIRSVRIESTSQYDTIVSVCQDSVEENISSEQEYHHIPLADSQEAVDQWGGSCEYQDFSQAVDRVLSAEGETLVHCHKGRDRSVSVLIAAIAVEEGRQYQDVWEQVKYYRPQAMPSDLMREHARRYIDRHS